MYSAKIEKTKNLLDLSLTIFIFQVIVVPFGRFFRIPDFISGYFFLDSV